MQIPPTDAVLPAAAQPGGAVPLRLLAGELPALPAGTVVEATVTRAGPRDAVLTVNGQPLTVRPSAGLQPGAVLLVRVPPTPTAPTLEVVGRVAPQPAGIAAPGTPTTARPATVLPTQLPGSSPVPVTGQGDRLPAAAPDLTSRAAVNGPATPTGRVTTTSAERTGAAGSPLPTGEARPPVGVPTPPPKPGPVSLVDVLAVLPDGRVRVRLDGSEQIATTAEKFTPGGRYVVQVERTPAGLTLRPAPDSPELPAALAGAVLRGTRPPDLGAALKPLIEELAALNSPATEKPPAAVREAAATVRETLRTLLPADAKPPGPAQLQALVADGGLHFEAKLARLVSPPETGASPASQSGAAAPPATAAPGQPARPTTPTAPAVTPATTPPLPTADAATVQAVLRALVPTAAALPNPVELPAAVEPAAPPTAGKPTAAVGGLADAPETPLAPETATARTQPSVGREREPASPPVIAPADAPTARPDRDVVGPDLKGDLMRLLQAVQDLGGAANAFPAARAALDGIEAQQATNALAQATGTPYFLQVPFPDGANWKTLHLALEPEQRRGRHDDPSAGGAFRLLMHVPLTDLGETWVDAGVSDNRFRAVLYLDKPETRDRVRAELGDLRRELQDGGFSEVLLDVRATADLPARHRQQGSAMRAGRPETVSVIDVRA